MNRNSVHERMTLPRATIEQASIQIPFVRYLSHIIFVFADVILYNICKCKCYEVCYMGKRIILTPSIRRILQQMGEQIKLARLRRNIPASLIAERSGLGQTTIWQIEKGIPSVSIGAYAKALHAIEGMDKELLRICREDEQGRMIQDASLVRRRASKRKMSAHHDAE